MEKAIKIGSSKYADNMMIKTRIKNWIKNIINSLPYVKTLKRRIDELEENKPLYPPGHFYSPIPSRDDILKREEQIFDNPNKGLDGIDLNEKEQLELLKKARLDPYTI